MLNNTLSDLRYGMRLLRKSPGFAAIAICALALGIGANTAIFSTVDAVLLRDLPYKDADRLVMLWQEATFVGFPRATPTPGDYSDWKRQNRVFEGMGAMRFTTSSLTLDGSPEQVLGQAVTPDFFSVLGVQPVIGRVFSVDEDRSGAQVMVISYGLWQRRYQGDPAIVGRTIPMNGAKFTVTGVMPRGFVFQADQTDYWVPANLTPAQLANRAAHYLNVVARLKPGATIARAREDVHAIVRRLQDQGLFDKRSDVLVIPLREDLLGNTRQALFVLLAAAGCVLLIACANLANLLLARSMGRRREMAVRTALGAGRARLVRQMVTESVLLSLAGGVIGLCVAFASMKLLARLVPSNMPATAAPLIDARLLGFTLLLSIATGLIFSIVPAMQTAKASLNEALKQGGRGSSGAGRRMRDALAVLEVASALVLLVGAGLLLRTLANLRGIDIGFRADHLLTMRTVPARTMTHTDRMNYYDRVIAGVRALPGVENAAFVSDLPFQQSGNSQAFQIEGRSTQENGPVQLALYRVGTNNYLKTLGVRAIGGRLIEESDGANAAPVIVITETFARRLWMGESPLGHRLKIGGPDTPWHTIIGVVADVHERGYEPAMMPGMYLPAVQTPNAQSDPRELLVRTKGDPAGMAEAVRRIIWSVNPQQPVARVRTMDDLIDLDVADRKQQTILLGSFAALALLLAAIGLYGVLSYGVTQRSREIGLRIALGASSTNVTRMIVGQGLGLTGAGLAVGCAASLLTTRAMSKLLYGVQATDPATFAAVAAVLAGIATIACWIPARRASRLDPMVALRDE
jgi:putative ABC transport system permease protein